MRILLTKFATACEFCENLTFRPVKGYGYGKAKITLVICKKSQSTEINSVNGTLPLSSLPTYLVGTSRMARWYNLVTPSARLKTPRVKY